MRTEKWQAGKRLVGGVVSSREEIRFEKVPKSQNPAERQAGFRGNSDANLKSAHLCLSNRAQVSRFVESPRGFF